MRIPFIKVFIVSEKNLQLEFQAAVNEVRAAETKERIENNQKNNKIIAGLLDDNRKLLVRFGVIKI
jgi:hypothetical protein